jgi:hypothetical protein
MQIQNFLLICALFVCACTDTAPQKTIENVQTQDVDNDIFDTIMFKDSILYVYKRQTKQFVTDENLKKLISLVGTEIIVDKNAIVFYKTASGREHIYDVFKLRYQLLCCVQHIIESHDCKGVSVKVQDTDCLGKLVGKEKRYNYSLYPENYKGEAYYKKYIE